jgi:tRNA(fMet)-specific endonuclease VapC
MGATYPHFAVLAFDEHAARAGAEVRDTLERRGIAIGTFDCMIAGHAIVTGRIMVTANVREFARVSGLTVQNWQS